MTVCLICLDDNASKYVRICGRCKGLSGYMCSNCTDEFLVNSIGKYKDVDDLYAKLKNNQYDLKCPSCRGSIKVSIDLFKIPFWRYCLFRYKLLDKCHLITPYVLHTIFTSGLYWVHGYNRSLIYYLCVGLLSNTIMVISNKQDKSFFGIRGRYTYFESMRRYMAFLELLTTGSTAMFVISCDIVDDIFGSTNKIASVPLIVGGLNIFLHTAGIYFYT